MAQEADALASPLDLPRQGYESPIKHIGSVNLDWRHVVSSVYDTNVFATDRNPSDDLFFLIEPRVIATRNRGKLNLNATAYLSHREYVSNTNENRTEYGLTGGGAYEINRQNSIETTFGAERVVESRTNPEARNSRFIPPSKINRTRGELSYQYEASRFNVTVRAGADRLNYLPADQANRDLTTYTGSGRLSLLLARAELFGQVYAAKRDFDDRGEGGRQNRDAATYGFMGGVNLDLTSRWRGEIGVGAFRSEPSDSSLRGFSGLSAKGLITWQPQPRTALTFEVFQGDVATVRIGANGRVDSRAGLELNQEIRHNLLLKLQTGYARTKYRGLTVRDLRTISGGGEVDYLVNRRITLFINSSYMSRNADLSIDRFDRGRVSVGVKVAI